MKLCMQRRGTHVRLQFSHSASQYIQGVWKQAAWPHTTSNVACYGNLSLVTHLLQHAGKYSSSKSRETFDI
ncbi:hypothetical protein LEMLEM_LOCUS15120 [Lemmus lemmus]